MLGLYIYSPVHKCWPKTSFQPILATQEPLTAFHGIKQKKKFWTKKNPKWPTQKNYGFQTVNSQYFSAKLSGIGPWVSRINWCKGHQCDPTNMVVRLSDDIRPKTGKKCMRSWANTYADDCKVPRILKELWLKVVNIWILAWAGLAIAINTVLP